MTDNITNWRNNSYFPEHQEVPDSQDSMESTLDYYTASVGIWDSPLAELKKRSMDSDRSCCESCGTFEASLGILCPVSLVVGWSMDCQGNGHPIFVVHDKCVGHNTPHTDSQPDEWFSLLKYWSCNYATLTALFSIIVTNALSVGHMLWVFGFFFAVLDVNLHKTTPSLHDQLHALGKHMRLGLWSPSWLRVISRTEPIASASLSQRPAILPQEPFPHHSELSCIHYVK